LGLLIYYIIDTIAVVKLQRVAKLSSGAIKAKIRAVKGKPKAKTMAVRTADFPEPLLPFIKFSLSVGWYSYSAWFMKFRRRILSMLPD
jgi:hypothetical protein